MDTQTVKVKDKPADHDERMAELVRQGDFYRVGVVHAKEQIKQAARPEALFHSAVDHASWAVRSRIDGLLHPTGASVASIMPFALTVLRFIRHRRMGKAALGVALVLGGVGLYLQQKRQRAVV
jgi:aryl-alcohol dehydrogenase-like predicted oxidoreductase